jgi:2-amino-4-hydroxy-6-hydroxymethyldihydropteridine diphosphokinase
MDVLRGPICFIGIGSNMAEPENRCREAIDRISRMEGLKPERVSSFYRTEPVGLTVQEWFVNAVCEIRTLLAPRRLHQNLKDMEIRMGRTETVKWGPRVIDLDLLLYSQDIIKEEDLVIPHPELHKRRFVLVPLCEIAPYVIHPTFGVSMKGLLDRLQDHHIVERM